MRNEAKWQPFIIWSATLGWTVLLLFLMLSPGEDTAAEEVSGFFGGTELSDAVGHVNLFGVLTALWQRALALHIGKHRALTAAVAIGLGLGVATELAQLFIPDRGAGLADMLANWIGAALAAAILRYRRR